MKKLLCMLTVLFALVCVFAACEQKETQNSGNNENTEQGGETNQGDSQNENSNQESVHMHSYGEWSVTKEATCTETGLKEKSCTKCEHSETEDIPMSEHTEAVIQGVESTCSSVGLPEGKCCSVCNKILVSQTETEKKPHVFGEWTKNSDGT